MATKLAEQIVANDADGVLHVDNKELEGVEIECDTRHLTIRATFKDGSAGPRWVRPNKEDEVKNG